MIQGIDHIELIVRDLEAYVDFLTRLGFETVRRTAHHGGSIEMKPPGDKQPVFELHQVIGEEVIGINHIAYRVADVAAAHDALAASGVELAGKPHFVEATGRTNVNLRDPDGWRVQLVDGGGN